MIPTKLQDAKDHMGEREKVLWVVASMLLILGVYRGLKKDEKDNYEAQQKIVKAFQKIASDIEKSNADHAQPGLRRRVMPNENKAPEPKWKRVQWDTGGWTFYPTCPKGWQWTAPAKSAPRPKVIHNDDVVVGNGTCSRVTSSE